MKALKAFVHSSWNTDLGYGCNQKQIIQIHFSRALTRQENHMNR